MRTEFILIGIITSFSLYFCDRNRRVAELMRYLNEIMIKWSIRHPNEDSAYKWFAPKIPKYEKMLYSFKSLKLEKWFEDEDIKKLLS